MNTYYRARDKAPTKITDDALLHDLEEYPDDYQYERVNHLCCSKTSIHHALKRLKLRQKKEIEQPKVCPMKRAKYLNHLSNYLPQGYPIVCMDESDFEAEIIRPYSYAPIRKPYINRYSILIATTGKQKSVLMLLVLCMKRCYLRFITFSRTLIASYSITGVNTH